MTSGSSIIKSWFLLERKEEPLWFINQINVNITVTSSIVALAYVAVYAGGLQEASARDNKTLVYSSGLFKSSKYKKGKSKNNY